MARYGSSLNLSAFDGRTYIDRAETPLNKNLFPPAGAVANPFLGLSLPLTFNSLGYRDGFFDGSAFSPNIIQGEVSAYLGAPFSALSYRDTSSQPANPNLFTPTIVALPFYGLLPPISFNQMNYRDSYFDANAILPVFQPSPNPFVNVWMLQIR
jgi:hypothetical protein